MKKHFAIIPLYIFTLSNCNKVCNLKNMKIKNIEYQKINNDRLCKITFKDMPKNVKPKIILKYFGTAMNYFDKIGEKKVRKIKNILKQNTPTNFIDELFNLIIEFSGLSEYELEFVINHKPLDCKELIYNRFDLIENNDMIARPPYFRERFNLYKYSIIFKIALIKIYSFLKLENAFLGNMVVNNSFNNFPLVIRNKIKTYLLKKFMNCERTISQGCSFFYNNTYDKLKFYYKVYECKWSNPDFKGSIYTINRNDEKEEIFFSKNNILNNNSNIFNLNDNIYYHLSCINHKKKLAIWNEGRGIGSTGEPVLLCISKPDSKIFLEETSKVKKFIFGFIFPIFSAILMALLISYSLIKFIY
ncbi:MAG: hypothetical protein GY830_05570 [Bacteroidetes bacterium]|nr:hypothetical protein [Bacteroidota bacterium]